MNTLRSAAFRVAGAAMALICADVSGGLVASSSAQALDGFVKICEPSEETHSAEIRDALTRDRAALKKTLTGFNQRCAQVPEGSALASECKASFSELTRKQKAHNAAVDAYCAATQWLRVDGGGKIFTEASADLVKMLDDTARRLKLPKGAPHDRELASMNCQALFRGVAASLAAQGKPSWKDDFPNMQADDIAKRLNHLAKTGGAWRAIALHETQALANSGAIVVGASQRGAGAHGHLAFVFPVPQGVKPENFHGSGPFVRDGNEHHLRTGRYALSGWGAVRASEAFGRAAPQWFVWSPPSKPQ